MVKTINSNIKSSGLDAVVEQLKLNNEATVKQTNAINTLLQDNQNARLEEKRTLVAERAVEQRKEGLAKKSRLEALRERKPTGITGSFTRGLIGGTAYGALGAGLGGLGIGGGIGALLRGTAGLAGKGLLFGGLVAATNSLIQGVLDRAFDDVKPEDMGFDDEDRAREKIVGGMNAAIALKFLGARGRTALLTGIGLAFSDQITDFIANRLGTDRLTAPDWMQKTFGLTEDQLTIDLKDGKVGAAIGAAVSLIAGQIAFMGINAAGRTVKNFVLPKRNSTTALANQRGFNPLLKAPAAQTNINMPKFTTNVDKPVAKISDFADDLKKMQKSGMTVGGLKMSNTAGARPQLTSGKFASAEQVRKALTQSAEELADAKKKMLVAENRFKNTTATTSSGRLGALKGPLSKSLNFLNRASGPLSVGISGLLGVFDKERIDAGQGATFRTVTGIGEGATGLLDFVVNGTYGLMMKGINVGLEKAGSDLRVQDEFNYTAAFRTGTFIGFEAAKNAIKPTEKEIENLTLGGSESEGGNLLITNDQINNNNTFGTNNFSMNSNPFPFANPYAEIVPGR